MLQSVRQHALANCCVDLKSPLIRRDPLMTEKLKANLLYY